MENRNQKKIRLFLNPVHNCIPHQTNNHSVRSRRILQAAGCVRDHTLSLFGFLAELTTLLLDILSVALRLIFRLAGRLLRCLLRTGAKAFCESFFFLEEQNRKKTRGKTSTSSLTRETISDGAVKEGSPVCPEPYQSGADTASYRQDNFSVSIRPAFALQVYKPQSAANFILVRYSCSQFFRRRRMPKPFPALPWTFYPPYPRTLHPIIICPGLPFVPYLNSGTALPKSHQKSAAGTQLSSVLFPDPLFIRSERVCPALPAAVLPKQENRLNSGVFLAPMVRRASLPGAPVFQCRFILIDRPSGINSAPADLCTWPALRKTNTPGRVLFHCRFRLCGYTAVILLEPWQTGDDSRTLYFYEETAACDKKTDLLFAACIWIPSDPSPVCPTAQSRTPHLPCLRPEQPPALWKAPVNHILIPKPLHRPRFFPVPYSGNPPARPLWVCRFLLYEWELEPPLFKRPGKPPILFIGHTPVPGLPYTCRALIPYHNDLADIQRPILTQRLNGALSFIIHTRALQELEEIERLNQEALKRESERLSRKRPKENFNVEIRKEIRRELRHFRRFSTFICGAAMTFSLLISSISTLYPDLHQEASSIQTYSSVFYHEYGTNPSLIPDTYGYSDKDRKLHVESSELKEIYGTMDYDGRGNLVLHTEDGLLPTGEYIMYLTDREESVPFTLVVHDTVKPVFTHTTPVIRLTQGESLNLSGWFTAEDASGVEISTDSHYDIWSPGEYSLTIQAKDSHGNITTTESTLIVEY